MATTAVCHWVRRCTDNWRVSAAILALIYLLVWAFTGAYFMGDTNVYTGAILSHHHQIDRAPNGTGELPVDPFWDFGHLLWRPFGLLCFTVARPLTRLLAGPDERAQVILTLNGISSCVGLLAVLLFFGLTARTLRNNRAALVATLGFLFGDAFLNYEHTGNAYVTGLTCLVAGMYAIGLASGNRTWRFSTPAAGLLCLAVLFWFPYIFVLPAAMALPFFQSNNPQRIRLVLQTCLLLALFGLTAYVAGISAAGIRDMPELKAWVLGSGHGRFEVLGAKAAARMAFSMPRSFIDMGQTGMWLKRYLVRDPYAPLSFSDLLRLSLWKLIAFYLAIAVVCAELLTSKQGRPLFFWLVAATVPLCLFALFIFEAGALDRYLPLYPFIFLVCAFVLSSESTRAFSKACLISLIVVLAIVNVNAMLGDRLESHRTVALTRIHELIPLLRRTSLVIAVNEQDDLAQFRSNFPLDPANRVTEWQTYDILEINTRRLSMWREDFANRVAHTWERGGDVWLPARVFSVRPQPNWNWVEGDDPRIRWSNVCAFFSQFETGRIVGGKDGFRLLSNSARNQEILDSLTEHRSSEPEKNRSTDPVSLR
jgi:hypothetical protein